MNHTLLRLLLDTMNGEMDQEIMAFHTINTWTLVPKPPGVNIIANKWLYRIKRRPDGTIDRYKARLVAKDFTQLSGIDYKETYSPVIKATTIRLILALATMNKWQIKQLDVTNTFLHGNVTEELYMAQPQGYVNPTHPHHICKLHRSIYGLK